MFKQKRLFLIFLFIFLLFFFVTNAGEAGYYAFSSPLFYLFYSIILIWFFKNIGIGAIIPVIFVCIAGVLFFYYYNAGNNIMIFTPLLFQVLVFILIPCIFSLLIIKKFTIATAIFIPVLSIYFLIFIPLAIYIYINHLSILSILTTYLDLMLKNIIGFYRRIGISNSVIVKLKPSLLAVLKDFFLLFPAIAIIFSWISIWLSFIFIKRFSKVDEQSFFEKNRDLTAWRSSELFIIVLLTGMGSAILATGLYKFIGYNIILLSSSVYFAQGATIIAFFLKKTDVNLFLRILAYTLIIIFSNPFIIFVILLGVFDGWFNFRKLNSNGLKT